MEETKPPQESVTERYPFDLHIMQPGTVLDADWCERHLPGKTETKFEFRMLALKKQIEDETRLAGIPVVARIHNGTRIKILAIDEGDRFIQERCMSHLHSYAKDVARRLVQVQVDKLSPEQKQQRDRDIAIHAMRLQSIKGVGGQVVRKAITETAK